jgi:glutaredoxin
MPAGVRGLIPSRRLALPGWRSWPIVLACILLAAAAPTSAASAQTIELYGRTGCPRCAEARDYLRKLARERPSLQVVEYDVEHDPRALARLRGAAARNGVTTAGVPAFLVGDRIIVGFDRASTPARLRTLLDGGEVLGAENGICDLEGDPCEQAPTEGEIDVPLFGHVSARRLGLPLFTIVIGLVDGFNPCATWVLLFLLAMLVNLRSRRRMVVVAGTFVVVSGLVYFAFMAAWLTVFTVLGVSTPVRLVLGAIALFVGAVNVKDFFAFHRGLTLSIPDRAKPGFYARIRAVVHAENLAGALAGIVVVAFLVNLIELLCTAGLPAVYTAVLTSHDLPAWRHYAYLGLYILAYILDDAILVAIGVVTLGKRKLQERGGRWLKLLSGAVMLLLGAALLLRPEWLGSIT